MMRKLLPFVALAAALVVVHLNWRGPERWTPPAPPDDWVTLDGIVQLKRAIPKCKTSDYRKRDPVPAP